MKKKFFSFLIVLLTVLVMTISTVVVNGLISPQLADEDFPDSGDITPLTVNEYV